MDPRGCACNECDSTTDGRESSRPGVKSKNLLEVEVDGLLPMAVLLSGLVVLTELIGGANVVSTPRVVPDKTVVVLSDVNVSALDGVELGNFGA